MTRVFVVPMDLPSIANKRMHWAARARLLKMQRKTTRAAWIHAGRPIVSMPARVTIVRVSPRLLDRDNLVSACKATQDEVAAIFGVDDREEELLRFEWEQEKSKQKEVRVVMTTREDAAGAA